MNIGERLRQLREQNDLTLEEVGKQIGVNKATVQKYESGILDITRKMAIKLADILHTTPSYIMGWSETNDDFVYSDDEKSIITKYRLLDGRGKQAVNDTLTREFSYMSTSKMNLSRQRRKPLPYAAAGGVTDNLDEAKSLYDKVKCDDKNER